MVPRRSGVVGLIVCAVAAGFAVHHVIQLRDFGATDLEVLAAAAFLWLTVTSVVSFAHRDVPVTAASRALTDRLRVLVTIPAHNEDPSLFLATLDALAAQSRPPDRLHVVENGDPAAGYVPQLREVVIAWQRRAAPPFDVFYTFNPLADKRWAQEIAWRADPEADIIVTVDSDVMLHHAAIERGTAPFADPGITSVAGNLLGSNARANLLTRLVELTFVSAFLNGRAAYSMARSVNVNAGGLAFYRAAAIRPYLPHYLTQTVAGRRMKAGDDAMLTRYALLEGQCVFQATAWAVTPHPPGMRQLQRQRVRWWRSFWWGSFWVLRAFPPTRLIWWITLWLMASHAVTLPILLAALAVAPALSGSMPWQLGILLLALPYMTTARYLTFARPGESMRKRLGIWAAAPLAGLLNLYLGPVLQLAGLVTCLNTGWATRASVEVGLVPRD